MYDSGRMQGVYVSLITPFHQDEISYELLQDHVQRLNDTDISGYLVLGGNSESMGMSEEEKLKVLQTVVAHADGRTVIGGIARESTTETIREARRLADNGAHLLRVMPPHYFASKMDDALLCRFYQDVADAAPRPILIYHVPKLTSGLQLTAESVAELAVHPNIAGIKDSSADGIYGFLAAVRDIPDFSVLAGTANIFFPSLICGADGGDLTLANYLPKQACNLYQLSRQGSIAEGKRLHLSLYRINKAVSGKYGVPGIKAAMNLLGHGGGEPRGPFVSLTKEQRNVIDSVLRDEGML